MRSHTSQAPEHYSILLPVKLMRFLISALLMLAMASAVSASPPSGIWKYEQRSFIAKADLFTTLNPDGTCNQVARGRALGMTRWVVNTCRWSIADEVLSLEMMTSTQDGVAGSTAQFTILESTAEKLLLQVDDEQHMWTRTSDLPAHFAQRLAEQHPNPATNPRP